MSAISRKDFLKSMGSLMTGSAFGAVLGFPNVILPKKQEKLGVALVGLGQYSSGQLAPALQETEHCELRGIVTGTPAKISQWQEQYDIPDRNVYNYTTMPELADNDEIDVVYVVVPPSLHAKYSITAAEAGKHVWCEKPMAMDVKECQSMIDAADKNGVSLAIGYRLHHEPNNQTVMEFGEEEKYGPVEEVKSGAGFNSSSHTPEHWRADAERGGGSLYDMGVYAINAARYATGMEPVAVTGKQYSEREVYNEVDEFTEFTLEFPEEVVAYGESSFGKRMNYLEVNCRDGWYKLEPFQSYTSVQGVTSDGTNLPPAGGNQQARQMDNEALAIKKGDDPHVPGEEGLRDIRIVEAIMESSRKGESRIEL